MDGLKPTRRSYGSGRLYTRTDHNGRETFYGSFYINGRRVNRRLGPKRSPGDTRGLTQTQAEKELRRAMETAIPSARPRREPMTVEEVSARYITHAERRGRKLSTLENIESETRVHLAPFFRGRTLETIRHEDVLDLLTVLEAKGLSPKSIRNVIGTLSACSTSLARRSGGGPPRTRALASSCQPCPTVPRSGS